MIPQYFLFPLGLDTTVGKYSPLCGQVLARNKTMEKAPKLLQTTGENLNFLLSQLQFREDSAMHPFLTVATALQKWD